MHTILDGEIELIKFLRIAHCMSKLVNVAMM